MMQRSSYERLLQIEGSIAMPDRQRVMILDTSYLALQTVLREHWMDLRQRYAISEMIARRMFYYYQTQKQLKKVLQVSIAAAASDVLEQVIGMYISAYLTSIGSFEVKINSLFSYTGGQVRPDIAVLHNGVRLATVEVKTDLGWQRDYCTKTGWKERREKCKETAGFKEAILFVLAKKNWEKEYVKIEAIMEDESIFVLLKEHPNDERRFPWYENDSTSLEESDIIRPIESMFEDISGLCRH